MTINYKHPDYEPIWENRRKRLKKLKASEELRGKAAVFYKTHVVRFFNDWLATYDPRKNPATMPFILWKRQAEYLKWLQNKWELGIDGLVEKSRDMGITFLSMGFAIWLWLFYPGSKVGFGSRKQELVDELGNPDSIFEKGRFMVQNLPGVFLPVGFDAGVHMSFMKIINPANGNTIIGEIGDNIGRGGRNTMYFKDESAHYMHPEMIDRALSQNSDIKIDLSSVNGIGNPFHKKRFGGNIKVFVFDWREDPRKDQAWYEDQKLRHDPMTVAQEIDRDYNISVEQIIIPGMWVKACIGLKLPEDGAKICGLDVADEGPDSNAFIWRKGIVVKGIEAWKEGNTTQTTRRAYALCLKYGIPVLKYDSVGVGAGVKGEMWSIMQLPENLKKAKVHAQGVNTGAPPTSGMYAPGKPNKDMYRNLKAQLWWEMRRRIQRTFNWVNGDKKIPVDQLISLPNRPQLIMELSQPKYEHDQAGRLRVESKKKMRARGIKSPNEADALIICFSRSTGLDYRLLVTD